ncbi:hypothetical protein FA15DRAFT_338182 [Coprinopsis marcescibilis]|uniref:ATP-dependent DNA ligase family profile domain-containing protein n=1 Tax=Coprinopsis marcescibilis TaxID=230819 RepID=A0A5C3KBM4_COPMA|nr:hypothetical protein FA15DRAFT_338182 [Coprinopsis marcescibilis]
MNNTNPEPSEFTFSFLCSLFRQISRIKPRSLNAPRIKRDEEPPAVKLFTQWVTHLRNRFGPLSPGTTGICFRLIFPEEDHKRKYDMKESRLSEMLASCYGFSKAKFAQWDHSDASGCLGQELRSILEQTNTNDDDFISPKTIYQVDDLLNELSACCAYTDASIIKLYPKNGRRKRKDIMRDLFCEMRPDDAAWLAQIILKDLRPLLYPLEEMHFTVSLKFFNTKAVAMLSKGQAMRIWDPSKTMQNACRVFSDLDRAADIFDTPPDQRPKLVPVIGTMVESTKAQKCINVLSLLKASRKIWAEIKYDGERAQIHVELRDGRPPHITIFSKSKRDSTLDRHFVHDIIREALGFTDGSSSGRIKENVILDAEMVAFNGDKIDEFWRIRQLIETTAYGIRGKIRRRTVDANFESQPSMLSDDGCDTRQLGLVFFDVLSMGSSSKLFTPYHERRQTLESIIHPIPGKALLAERFPIVMSDISEAQESLRTIFAEQVADHQEGLVIKADESRYNDYKLPWVKLKKDYIPGHGDSIDMVLVGASWEKNRARELRVGPDTYTTFYIGSFKDKFAPKPELEVFYTASYGLTRDKLEELNFMIHSAETVSYPFSKRNEPKNYTFSLLKGLNPPSVLLQEPLLVELFGAGFTKFPGSKHYELRFPRIQKWFRPSERNWRNALDLRSLHDLARQVVGRDRSNKDADDAINDIWGDPRSPGVKCPLKRQEAASRWAEQFRWLDEGKKGSLTEPDPPTPSKRPRATSIVNASTTVTIRAPPRPKLQMEIERREQGLVSSSSAANSQGAVLDVINRALTPTSPTRRLGLTSIQTPISALRPPPSNHHQLLDNSKSSNQTPFSHERYPGPPTPSSSPVAAQPLKLTYHRQEKANPCTENLTMKGGATSYFAHFHVWFMKSKNKPSQSCETCRPLRKMVLTDRKVHSLNSLVLACGWEQAPPGAYVNKGAIIALCGDDDMIEKVQALAQNIQSLPSKNASERKPIFIFNCKSFDSGGTTPIPIFKLH